MINLTNVAELFLMIYSDVFIANKRIRTTHVEAH